MWPLAALDRPRHRGWAASAAGPASPSPSPRYSSPKNQPMSLDPTKLTVRTRARRSPHEPVRARGQPRGEVATVRAAHDADPLAVERGILHAVPSRASTSSASTVPKPRWIASPCAARTRRTPEGCPGRPRTRPRPAPGPRRRARACTARTDRRGSSGSSGAARLRTAPVRVTTQPCTSYPSGEVATISTGRACGRSLAARHPGRVRATTVRPMPCGAPNSFSFTYCYTQRDVVKNERRWSLDNQPYGTCWEKLQELSFPESHPFHHSLIGSVVPYPRRHSMTSRSSFRRTIRLITQFFLLQAILRSMRRKI